MTACKPISTSMFLDSTDSYQREKLLDPNVNRPTLRFYRYA
jgi:hypothetical protein